MIRVPITIKILVITNLHSILRVGHNTLAVVSSVEVHIIIMIVKQGIHPFMIRVLATIKVLVMTNLHFILRISNNSSTVVRSVEVPIIALIVKPGTSLSMSLILSSVDDLVPILRESELTFDSTDLEYREHLDTLSTGDREIDFDPIRDIEELECLLVDDPVPVLRVFDAPLGHSNLISRSFDVTFSNSLFDFNDDYNLCYDNPFFNEELEDISNLDPLESTPFIDESSLLVIPFSDPTHICLRGVERFDPFFSLTQIPYDLEDLRACFQSSNHAVFDHFHDYILGTLFPYDLEDLRACFQSSNHAIPSGESKVSSVKDVPMSTSSCKQGIRDSKSFTGSVG
ncbi:hypothetical protein Tco_0005394 [Tanacetum coccineum]